MLRCNESAGNFVVTMEHGEEMERRQQLQVHAPVYEQIELPNRNPPEFIQGRLLEDLPIFSSAIPFNGELCIHEVEQLKQAWRYISPELHFTLNEV